MRALANPHIRRCAGILRRQEEVNATRIRSASCPTEGKDVGERLVTPAVCRGVNSWPSRW